MKLKDILFEGKKSQKSLNHGNVLTSAVVEKIEKELLSMSPVWRQKFVKIFGSKLENGTIDKDEADGVVQSINLIFNIDAEDTDIETSDGLIGIYIGISSDKKKNRVMVGVSVEGLKSGDRFSSDRVTDANDLMMILTKDVDSLEKKLKEFTFTRNKD